MAPKCRISMNIMELVSIVVTYLEAMVCIFIWWFVLYKSFRWNYKLTSPVYCYTNAKKIV